MKFNSRKVWFSLTKQWDRWLVYIAILIFAWVAEWALSPERTRLMSEIFIASFLLLLLSMGCRFSARRDKIRSARRTWLKRNISFDLYPKWGDTAHQKEVKVTAMWRDLRFRSKKFIAKCHEVPLISERIYSCLTEYREAINSVPFGPESTSITEAYKVLISEHSARVRQLENEQDALDREIMKELSALTEVWKAFVTIKFINTQEKKMDIFLKELSESSPLVAKYLEIK